MAKTKVEEKQEAKTVNDTLATYLKDNQDSHYNYIEDTNYKVSTGVLSLDIEIGGGIVPGVHRMVGVTSGGKTSESLLVMKNFLESIPNSRGCVIKAEGRLDAEMQSRAGMEFTTDPALWKDGNCFLFESNVFETAIGLLRTLVKDNKDNKKYCFIIDSVDALIPKGDVDRPFEYADKVAGGALLSSKFLQKMTLALTKMGHMCFLIGQVRSEVKINPYEKTAPKLGNFSGGNAQLHYSNLLLEFLPRYQKDLILKDESKKPSDPGNLLGHYAKVKIVKSLNEKNLVELSYPIRYGRKGGNSVWIQREIADLLQNWDLLKRKGAWYVFDKDLIKEVTDLKDKDITLPEQLQGIDAVYEWFEQNPKLTLYIRDKFKKLLIPE